MESVAMASNTRIQSEQIGCKKGQTLPCGFSDGRICAQKFYYSGQDTGGAQ